VCHSKDEPELNGPLMTLAERRDIPASDRPGQQLLAAIFRSTLRILMKPMFHPRVPTSLLRAGMRTLTTTTLRAAGINIQPINLGGVPGEAASPEQPGDRAVLYLHGGAYCVGSPATHRAITSHLARTSGATVFAIDYRMAPEHPFPAASDDALTAYRWLLENGYAPERVFIAGDSAGGGLTLATALQIRDQHLPAPGGLILLSPWADLSLNRRNDPLQPDEAMLSWPTLEHAAALYAGEQRRHPLVSPLEADLDRLAPTLIIVGTDEILLGDSEALYRKMAAAGTPIRLSVYQNMWHVFPIQAGALATADAAVAEMAEWVKHPG
jgi:epsilon-lactone hydrolase